MIECGQNRVTHRPNNNQQAVRQDAAIVVDDGSNFKDGNIDKSIGL